LKGLKNNRSKKIENNINANYLISKVKERDRDRNYSMKSCDFGAGV
jgi:hypothetical protein